MKKIPTAEEVWKDYVDIHPESYGQNNNGLEEYITIATGDFEELINNQCIAHTQAALKAASEKAERYDHYIGSEEFDRGIDKDSILNAYPLTLIQ